MRRTSLAVLAIVAVITLVGCSSSKKSSSTSAGASASATTADKSSSGKGTLSGSFCTDSNAAASQNLALATGTDPASLQKNLDLLKKFASEAPSEIKSDVNVIVSDYSQIVQALASAQNDPSKAAAALAPLQKDQAALQTASDHITAYVASHCK